MSIIISDMLNINLPFGEKIVLFFRKNNFNSYFKSYEKVFLIKYTKIDRKKSAES